MRKYRIRKLRKLVDKCRSKKIFFSKYFVDISSRLAKNVDTVTNAELTELTTECFQSLNSEDDSSYDSSESASSGDGPKRKKTKTLYLTPSAPAFDKLNPYNVAWGHNRGGVQRFSASSPHTDVFMGYNRGRVTAQEQHDIFHQKAQYSPRLPLRVQQYYREPSSYPPPIQCQDPSLESSLNYYSQARFVPQHPSSVPAPGSLPEQVLSSQYSAFSQSSKAADREHISSPALHSPVMTSTPVPATTELPTPPSDTHQITSNDENKQVKEIYIFLKINVLQSNLKFKIPTYLTIE